MINLGLWQLRRLDERQDRNRAVEQRSALATEPVGAWLAPGLSDDEVADAEWRPLSAAGEYDDGATVLIRNRTLDGTPGYHVVTPLVMGDGTAVLVNRGFIARGEARETPNPPPAPAGAVEVVGRVRPTQERGLLGPPDPDDGVLTEAQRIDIPRLAQQLPYPVLPAYLELVATAPEPAASQPALLPLPALDDGPHLSYAMQWFLFSGLAIAGWILAVRRSVATARARRPTADGTDEPSPTPVP
jgi:cytochrome oxidase assembly protein ShyY1